MRFSFFIFRDFLWTFIATQLVIGTFAFLIYSIDSKDVFITKMHMLKHPKVFYYLAGLCSVLAAVGVVSTITKCGDEPTRCNNCHGPLYCDTYACDACCQGCGRGSATSARPCHCGSCGGCSGISCEACACENCGCNAGSLGGEAAGCVLVVLALFVLVGLFVAVLAGVAFVQRTVQTHIHILQKHGLAQDIAVLDLEPDGRVDLKIATSLSQHPSAPNIDERNTDIELGERYSTQLLRAGDDSTAEASDYFPVDSYDHMLQEDSLRSPTAPLAVATNLTDLQQRSLVQLGLL
jgi:hypothetical protein